MSVSSLRSQVERTQSDISSLQDKLSRATKKEADAMSKVARVQSSMNGRLSPNQLQSKLRELSRHQDEAAKAQKEQADINKRLADKTKTLHRYRTDLAKEEERERSRLHSAEKRRQRELASYSSQLQDTLDAQRAALNELTTQPTLIRPPKSHDLFISHASEDKDELVRPLAEAIESRGINVWYDEFQLKVGDSLRRSIDRGLADSKFGVVVLSTAFFAKNWTQYELDGLVAKEMDGVKVILPIWHRVTKDEVKSYSPTLADRVALNSSLKSIDEIADELASVAKEGADS